MFKYFILSQRMGIFRLYTCSYRNEIRFFGGLIIWARVVAVFVIMGVYFKRQIYVFFLWWVCGWGRPIVCAFVLCYFIDKNTNDPAICIPVRCRTLEKRIKYKILKFDVCRVCFVIKACYTRQLYGFGIDVKNIMLSLCSVLYEII